MVGRGWTCAQKHIDGRWRPKRIAVFARSLPNIGVSQPSGMLIALGWRARCSRWEIISDIQKIPTFKNISKGNQGERCGAPLLFQTAMLTANAWSIAGSFGKVLRKKGGEGQTIAQTRCVCCASGETRTILLARPIAPGAWHCVLVAHLRNASGATFAALLESELSASALLGYLRHRFAAAQSFEPLRTNKKGTPCFSLQRSRIAQTLCVCLHCCGARIALPLLARSRALRPRPLARLPLPAPGSGRLAPSRAVPALARVSPLRQRKKGTPHKGYALFLAEKERLELSRRV